MLLSVRLRVRACGSERDVLLPGSARGSGCQPCAEERERLVYSEHRCLPGAGVASRTALRATGVRMPRACHAQTPVVPGSALDASLLHSHDNSLHHVNDGARSTAARGRCFEWSGNCGRNKRHSGRCSRGRRRAWSLQVRGRSKIRFNCCWDWAPQYRACCIVAEILRRSRTLRGRT